MSVRRAEGRVGKWGSLQHWFDGWWLLLQARTTVDARRKRGGRNSAAGVQRAVPAHSMTGLAAPLSIEGVPQLNSARFLNPFCRL